MNEENKNTNGVEEVPAQKNIDAALKEFSRETGIRIELLRRFINRQTRQMINDPLGTLFPTIKDLLTECDKNAPRRIGPPYRRHAELVEMLSDQKVLLDVWAVLPVQSKNEVMNKWCSLVSSTPCTYASLTAEENKLMGAFMAMDEELRAQSLLEVIAKGREAIKNQRGTL